MKKYAAPFVCITAAFVSLFSSSSRAETALPDTITLGATAWCPYTCDEQRPGITTEYLRLLLGSMGVGLQVKMLPWSRAISEAESGELDGLLTLVKEESDQLLMTSVPTMSYQSCFYVSSTSSWHYSGPDSLAQIHLGAVMDYGYGEEVDSYLHSNKENEQMVTLISGNDTAERLAMMLLGGRIDAYIADRNVSLWLRKSGLYTRKETEAGCLDVKNFYLGINPQRGWAKALIQRLDQELDKPENKTRLEQIKALYR